MKLLIPLGLLGLLSIAALIIIYLIRPNYQQKAVSSTYVWKLSLQYKKKRVPISKLRNLLIILCQILILTAFALILSQPSLVLETKLNETEYIAVIDSSASMRTSSQNESRYNRAIDEVINLANDVLSKDDGVLSVVVADGKPHFLAERISRTGKDRLLDDLEDLKDDPASCAYGSNNVEAALELCDGILEENPYARINVYTDVHYDTTSDKNLKVVEIHDSAEWNAGILNAFTVYNDNYYAFYVDIACYGRDETVLVNIDVNGANATTDNSGGSLIHFDTSMYQTEAEGGRPSQIAGACTQDEPRRIVFANDIGLVDTTGFDEDHVDKISIPTDKQVFSYQYVYFSLDVDDNLADDNTFALYNGEKEVVKMLYVATEDDRGYCNFFYGILDRLSTSPLYKDRWDIQYWDGKSDYKLEGYDIYIFECIVPETLPEDGVVVIFDPTSSPKDKQFIVGDPRGLNDRKFLESDIDGNSKLAPLMNNIVPGNIFATMLTPLRSYDTSYETLMTCDGEPAVIARDEGASKVVVSLFSVHYSNIAITEYFSRFFRNIFNYYLPSTVDSNAFEVNESVQLNCRGPELTVTGVGGEKQIFDTFPATLSLNVPGTYTMTQVTDFNDNITEYVFVKLPASESNIFKQEDVLLRPYVPDSDIQLYDDLLIYFASVAVALLFIEWWLQSRDNM